MAVTASKYRSRTWRKLRNQDNVRIAGGCSGTIAAIITCLNQCTYTRQRETGTMTWSNCKNRSLNTVEYFWEHLHSRRKTSCGLISSSSINRPNHSLTHAKHKGQTLHSKIWASRCLFLVVSWSVVSSRYRKSWKPVRTSREAHRNMLENCNLSCTFGKEAEYPNL